MSGVASAYSHLHNLHTKLKRVQDQLARGPRQIAARRKKVAKAEEQKAELEAQLKEARASADKKNLDLKSKEAGIGELQSKLNVASSNREYDIVNGQIEADKAAMAVLEDEILEQLERVDGVTASIKEASETIATTEASVTEFESEFNSKAAGLKEEQQKLESAIKEAESIIPGELKEQYHRLVATYGSEAMASTANGICNNCFVTMTAQKRVLLNSGTVMLCPACGRLLYQSEAE